MRITLGRWKGHWQFFPRQLTISRKRYHQQSLPPVISRDGTYGPDLDSQEVYERGVTAALEQFTSSNLEKVVLARRSNLIFRINQRTSYLR
jgi:isochorismate synthase EntC